MKHTPGPWAFAEGDADRNAMSDVTKADDPEFRIAYVICDARNKLAREQDIANARLIAAAPDLLAALVNIAEAFDANDSHGIREEIERSRIAITKACGERGDAKG